MREHTYISSVRSYFLATNSCTRSSISAAIRTTPFDDGQEQRVQVRTLSFGRETRAHWCWPQKPARVRTLKMGLSFSWLTVGRETRAHGVDPGGPYTRDHNKRLVSMASPWKPGYYFSSRCIWPSLVQCTGLPREVQKNLSLLGDSAFRTGDSYAFAKGIWILYTVSSSSVYPVKVSMDVIVSFSVAVVRSSEFIVDRTE